MVDGINGINGINDTARTRESHEYGYGRWEYKFKKRQRGEVRNSREHCVEPETLIVSFENFKARQIYIFWPADVWIVLSSLPQVSCRYLCF